MKVKQLSVLVLVLAVLSAVTWFINRPSPPPGLDPRTGRALITRDILAAARSITLSDDDNSVTLTTSEDGGDWLVSDYYDFPVDFGKLSSMVEDLRNAKIIRLVTRNPDRMKRLDFGKTAIAIGTGGAIPAFHLDLGKTSDDGGRYIRFADEEKAYLATLSLYLDATPKSWAQSRLLDFKAAEVARLVVDFSDLENPLTLSRDDDAASWENDFAQENGGVNSSAVTSLINRFTNLRYTDTADIGSEEAASAREHARHLSIELFDGTIYRIGIGRRPPPSAPPSEQSPREDPATESPAKPEPGPVFLFVESNRDDAQINDLMARRSFEISEYTLTSLPTDIWALLEPIPEPEPDVAVESSEEVSGESDSDALPQTATP